MSRAELIEKRGYAVVAVAPDRTTTMRELLARTTAETFETAASLYNPLMVALRADPQEPR